MVAPASPLRVGICGLGRAFSLMLPAFLQDARFTLAGAFDPDAQASERFRREFDAPTFSDYGAFCSAPELDVIYIASPHQWHAEHAVAALRAGKPVLVEKPMAVTLAECRAMVAAAKASNTALIVGPSHSFDRPVLHARALIESGKLGRVRMIQALNYTDFLYRPRRPEELDTRQGGGVVFSQGAHQIDMVRLLGGGLVRTVRAQLGNWDPARPTEGAYMLALDFVDGAFAALTYSGYAHFDSDELMGWRGELGHAKPPERYGDARRKLAGIASAAEEAALKRAGNLGGSAALPPWDAPLPGSHEHFGLTIISCEKGDLRLLPDGVAVYGDTERRIDQLPVTSSPRQPVLDELYAAVVQGRPPLHSGEWSLATMEVCLGALQSAAKGGEVTMTEQIPAPVGALG